MMSRLYNVYRSRFTRLFRWGSGPVELQPEVGPGDGCAPLGTLLELHDEEGNGRIGLTAADVPEDENPSVGHGLFDHFDRRAYARSEVTPADIEVVVVDNNSGPLNQHSVLVVSGNGRLAVRDEFLHPPYEFTDGGIHQNIALGFHGFVRGHGFLNCCVHDFLRSWEGNLRFTAVYRFYG